MKKSVAYAVGLSATLLLLFTAVTYFQTPLSHVGITAHQFNDRGFASTELRNTGWLPLRVTNILLTDKEGRSLHSGELKLVGTTAAAQGERIHNAQWAINQSAIGSVSTGGELPPEWMQKYISTGFFCQSDDTEIRGRLYRVTVLYKYWIWSMQTDFYPSGKPDLTTRTL